MSRHSLFILVFSFLPGLAGCSSAPPPPATNAAKVPKPRPFPLFVEDHRQIPDEDMQVWTLKVNRIKQLVASLVVFQNGERFVADRYEYHWTKWEQPDSTADGQISLRFENPQSDTRVCIPSLKVEFPESQVGSHTETKYDFMVSGPWKPGSSAAISTGSITASANGRTHTAVLASQAFVPDDFEGITILNPNMDALRKVSQSGKIVVVVALEWKMYHETIASTSTSPH